MNTIPNDYKSHLEKIVADLYKKFDEEDQKRVSLKIADDNYIKIQKQLAELIKTLNKPEQAEPVQFIGNTQFLKLMDISSKTAQTWRDTGTVSFSQVGSKIYYRISDIQVLLDRNYHKSTKQ